MDAADPDLWSFAAADWASLFGAYTRPAWDELLSAAGVRAGTRVLDIGCGTGDLLVYLRDRGAVVSGVDPAPGMVDLVRERLPGADLRVGSFEELGPDASVDVATAINSLQFVDEPAPAVAAMMRAAVPGGRIAVAVWAEPARNDLAVVTSAVAHAFGEPGRTSGPLQEPGAIDSVLRSAGLADVVGGEVELPWQVDADSLVRGALFGTSASELRARAATVLDAAEPFRREDGSYRLVNVLRWAVGRTPLDRAVG